MAVDYNMDNKVQHLVIHHTVVAVDYYNMENRVQHQLIFDVVVAVDHVPRLQYAASSL